MSPFVAQRKLEVIVKGARAILEKHSFEDTARQIFDLCRDVTGARSGYVAMLNNDGSENEVLFLEAGGMPCDVDPELPMPVRGLREVAYRTHQAVYDNNFMQSKWMEYMPEGHVELKNVLFAPLNLDGRTVGIIGLANKGGDFTNDDASVAETLGDLASIALQNSIYLDKLNGKNTALEHAISEIKTLRGIIPICMYCKEIRDDEGYWNQLEKYLSLHTDAQLSHGICDKCMEKLYPENMFPQNK
jgi:GAF domain-containing protein